MVSCRLPTPASPDVTPQPIPHQRWTPLCAGEAYQRRADDRLDVVVVLRLSAKLVMWLRLDQPAWSVRRRPPRLRTGIWVVMGDLAQRGARHCYVECGWNRSRPDGSVRPKPLVLQLFESISLSRRTKELASPHSWRRPAHDAAAPSLSDYPSCVRSDKGHALPAPHSGHHRPCAANLGRRLLCRVLTTAGSGR